MEKSALVFVFVNISASGLDSAFVVVFVLASAFASASASVSLHSMPPLLHSPSGTFCRAPSGCVPEERNTPTSQFRPFVAQTHRKGDRSQDISSWRCQTVQLEEEETWKEGLAHQCLMRKWKRKKMLRRRKRMMNLKRMNLVQKHLIAILLVMFLVNVGICDCYELNTLCSLHSMKMKLLKNYHRPLQSDLHSTVLSNCHFDFEQIYLFD